MEINYNFYIVRQNEELKLALYPTLATAKADSAVELLHDNHYTDRMQAVWDLNYFKNKELEEKMMTV